MLSWQTAEGDVDEKFYFTCFITQNKFHGYEMILTKFNLRMTPRALFSRHRVLHGGPSTELLWKLIYKSLSLCVCSWLTAHTRIMNSLQKMVALTGERHVNA